MKKHRCNICCLIFLLPLYSVSAFATDEVARDIVEISLGVGYYHFDGDRNLEDAEMATAGLGLQFSRRWLVLLQYASLNTERTANNAGQNVDMEKYHIDVHHFFNTGKSLRPYIVAGFGQMDLDSPGNKIIKNMLNAGLGLSYTLTPSWFLRADARIFASTNNDFKDDALTLTLGYRFNGGEKAN